jgi:protein HEXIM1/2
MQEHDDMYHFESQQPHFRLVSTEDDEEMRMGRGGSDPFGSQSSSLDDEEEFLNRDFSNAYDVIHAERLNSMTKIELIQEYQLLEERVETLERKIRTRHSLQPIQTGGSGSPYHTTGSPYHTTGSPFHPASKGSYGGSDIPIKLLEEEVRDLREENRKLRLENKMLAARRQLPSEMASEENEIDQ